MWEKELRERWGEIERDRKREIRTSTFVETFQIYLSSAHLKHNFNDTGTVHTAVANSTGSLRQSQLKHTRKTVPSKMTKLSRLHQRRPLQTPKSNQRRQVCQQKCLQCPHSHFLRCQTPTPQRCGRVHVDVSVVYFNFSYVWV